MPPTCPTLHPHRPFTLTKAPHFKYNAVYLSPLQSESAKTLSAQPHPPSTHTMKTVHLHATPRKNLHKAATKVLRKEGYVPVMLYGFSQPNTACTLPMVDLLPLLDTITPHFIELKLDKKNYTCILNEVQYHPVSDIPLHIDLLHITDERPIRLDIPVSFTGEAPGILKGGELAVKKRTIPVRALPKHMPEKLTIDISQLDLGDKVTVQAIPQGDYTLLTQPQVPVAVVMIPRALRSKTAEASNP